MAKRVSMYLADAYFVPDSAGGWYLVQGGPKFTVYQLDQDLKPTRLGVFAGKGHHSVRISDARFISKDVLHLFWGDVLPGGRTFNELNNLCMRCIDFDVKQKKWLHNRELFRLDEFVSSANEPTVLQLKDDSLHYIWRVEAGAERGESTGLYYQAESDGKTVKISKSGQYRAVVSGERIVVCYTQENAPDKVFIRAIQHGQLGPASEIEASKERKHCLRSEYMVLHSEGDRIWFVNTLARNTICELRIVYANNR